MRSAIVLATAFVVAACAALPAQKDHPVNQTMSSAANLRPELAVSRIVTGNPPRREVIALDPGGRVLRTLTRGVPVSLYSGGTWSPDGRLFAFVGRAPGSEETASDVYVVNANGSAARRLTMSGRVFEPVWAPDGRSLVVAERVTLHAPPSVTLARIDVADGRLERLLQPEAGRIDLPNAFAPSGELAFTRWRWRAPGPNGRVANTRDVALLDLQTLQTRTLIDRAADAAFSPDGARLAYVTDRDENGELSYGDVVFYANELYVLDVRSGDARRLTRTRDLNEAAPSWSPDGSLIAYQRGKVTGNAEGSIVMTIGADGICPRRVAFDPGLGVWYRTPAWRPASDAARVPACRPEPRALAVPLGGNMTLAEARRFSRFRLYWIGPRFGPFILSAIDRSIMSAPGGRGAVVSLHYGAIQLQLYPACMRVPAHVDLRPDRRERLRGVEAVFFEGGARMEIVTGRTTIVVFASPRQMNAIARALRRIGAPPRPKAQLPPPARGAAAGTVPCRRTSP